MHFALLKSVYLSYTLISLTTMADKDLVQITVRLSPKLKNDFERMCKEREINLSGAIRDLMTNSVRSYGRKSGKSDNSEQ